MTCIELLCKSITLMSTYLLAVDFTPYLLGLGLAKSQTSLVWIAPPLSGLIMQPVIGSITDSSTLKWGRRRPYILLCSVFVAIGLCVLAWAPEVVRFLPHNEEQVCLDGCRMPCAYAKAGV